MAKRENTQAELDKINDYIRRGNNKLIYYNALCNPYNKGWISRKAIHFYNRILSKGSSLFFSLKHPGKGIKIGTC